MTVVAAIIAAAPSQSVEIPNTVIGLVSLVVILVLGLATLVYRSQLAEREKHTAEMKAERDRAAAETKELTQSFNETIKEIETKHREEMKAITGRQQQFEDKLTEVVIASTTTQRENTRAIENFITLRDIQEEVRGSRKAVR